jgi:transcription antitermination factor NusG
MQEQRVHVTDEREARPNTASASDGASPRQWFALFLQANREFQVRAELERRGLECYLPTITEEHRWSDRNRQVERPVFRGYIFARLQPDEFSAATRVSGVSRILGSEPNRPEAIPEQQIADVARVLQCAADPRACPYVAGELVRIASGPLAGVKGTVTTVDGEHTLVVGIKFLGRAIKVKIDAAHLEAERT